MEEEEAEEAEEEEENRDVVVPEAEAISWVALRCKRWRSLWV